MVRVSMRDSTSQPLPFPHDIRQEPEYVLLIQCLAHVTHKMVSKIFKGHVKLGPNLMKPCRSYTVSWPKVKPYINIFVSHTFIDTSVNKVLPHDRESAYCIHTYTHTYIILLIECLPWAKLFSRSWGCRNKQDTPHKSVPMENTYILGGKTAINM